MEEITNGMGFVEAEAQHTRESIDPRDISVRRVEFNRALELVTTDYITRLDTCSAVPMPDNIQEQLSDIAQWTRLYHMDKIVYAPKENFLQKITTVLYTAYAQDTLLLGVQVLPPLRFRME